MLDLSAASEVFTIYHKIKISAAIPICWYINGTEILFNLCVFAFFTAIGSLAIYLTFLIIHHLLLHLSHRFFKLSKSGGPSRSDEAGLNLIPIYENGYPEISKKRVDQRKRKYSCM